MAKQRAARTRVKTPKTAVVSAPILEPGPEPVVEPGLTPLLEPGPEPAAPLLVETPPVNLQPVVASVVLITEDGSAPYTSVSVQRANRYQVRVGDRLYHHTATTDAGQWIYTRVQK